LEFGFNLIDFLASIWRPFETTSQNEAFEDFPSIESIAHLLQKKNVLVPHSPVMFFWV